MSSSPSKKCRKFLLLITAFGILFSSAAQELPRTPFLEIPECKKAPVIDGKISEKEWKNASEIVNFRAIAKNNGELANFQTRLYLMFNREYLFLGWECKIPEAKFDADIKKHDGQIWGDDSVEIFLDPEFKRKHYYQIVANALGTVYDANERDLKWESGLKYAACRNPQSWTGEMAIPFAAFGLKGAPADGQRWGMNFCRNQRTSFPGFPTETSMWSYSVGERFAAPADFAEVVFERKAPAIKISSLGKMISKQENKIDVKVINKERLPKKILLKLAMIGKKGIPEISRHTCTVTIEETLSLYYQPDSSERWSICLEALDAESGKILYSTGELPFQALFPLSVDLEPLYSRKELLIRINVRNLAQKPDCAVVSLSENGRIIQEKKIDISKDEHCVSLDMQKLKEKHSYKVKIALKDSRNKNIFSREFPYVYPVKPAWWNSKAGISDKVLPPWTALKIEGKNIGCWGRTYSYSNSPWPEQIISKGEKLLAAPITLNAETSEGKLDFSGGSWKQVSSTPAQAVFEYKKCSKNILFECKISIEFDGMIKTDFTLTPQAPLELKDLNFTIPLDENTARYFTYIWFYGKPRDNSNRIGKEGWTLKLPFKPYIWLGNEERGLCWFCETDENWKPYDRPDTLIIKHEKGQVKLAVNICKQMLLSKPWHITFGLEATPVKAKPENSLTGPLACKIHIEGGPMYPEKSRNYDLDIAKWKAAGCKTVVFHCYWADGFGRPYPYNPPDFKRTVKKLHEAGMLAVVYFSCYMFHSNSPAYQMCKFEWRRRVTNSDSGGKMWRFRPDMTIIEIGPAAPQWTNYLTYGIEKLIEEYDIDGVYYDSLGFYECENRYQGQGYRDEKGGSRPTYTIFPVREMGKRIYTLFKTRKNSSVIDNHRTGGIVVPIDAFVDSFLNGEYFANRGASQWAPLPMFRAEFTGAQFGLVADLIAYGNRNPYRMCYALALPHQVNVRAEKGHLDIFTRIWEIFQKFGVDKAQWHPYWENGKYLQVTPPDILASFYKNSSGEILMIVSNWSDKTREVSLKINFKALGLDEKKIKVEALHIPASFNRKSDAELDAEAILCNGNELKFQVGERNFRLIKITQ